MIDRHGRQHLFTESRGCICGSVIVATSPDAREVRNVVSKWEGLHPEGKYREGVPHERTSVDKARAIRKAKDIPVERSKIELR